MSVLYNAAGQRGPRSMAALTRADRRRRPRICDFCQQPAEGIVARLDQSDTDSPRVDVGHPDCYGTFMALLSRNQRALPPEEHPEDAAYLDSLAWQMPELRRYCGRCDRATPTVAVGHVECESGPGYETRHCRACVARELARARAALESALADRETQALTETA